MLGSQGFDVVWETDAFTALQTVEKHLPDLVICDRVLPDITGYEVCQSLRGNPLLDSVPVVLISGDVDDDVRRRTRECDAAGILAKPFTPALLIEKVEAILGAVKPLPTMEAIGGVPFALRSHVSAELDAFGVVDCQLACVVDGEGRMIAACGSANTESVRPALKRELVTLCKLLDLASEGKGGEIGGARLTVELDSGFHVVDGLEGGYLLVVISASPSELGLVRFLAKKAHQSLAAALRSELGDVQVAR